MHLEKIQIKSFLFMLTGCFFYALSLNLFFVPNKLVGGGITGLGTLINVLTGIGVGTLTILLNIPILIAALRTQGVKFVLKCFVTNLVLGIIINLLSFLPALTHSPILTAIYGGILQGIGIGLFYRYRYSSGGTELLARILLIKIKMLKPGQMIAVLDGIIVVTGSIVLNKPQNALLALIAIYIAAKISDKIITGFDNSKLVYIITKRPCEISSTLLSNSARGITEIKAKGMYKNSDQTILMTVIKYTEFTQLKEIVQNTDPDAFLIVSDTTEVLGQGFKSIDEI